MSAYVDTGHGITPDNFQQECCGTFGLTFASDVCNGWATVNRSLFGDYYSPCARGALANLKYPAPVGGVLPVPAPKIDTRGTPDTNPTYGQAINPCTNQPIVTAQDAIDLETCLAALQAEAQRDYVMRSMEENAAGQCGAIVADCANRTFASFLKPSDDCTECVFDWTKASSLFLIGGGLLVGGIILAKLLR